MLAVEPDDPTQTMGMLVYDVARLMRRHFAAQMAWSGLGQSSWRLLVHVARKPGLRAADLAEIMEMRPISVSRVLDGLVRSELIERRAGRTGPARVASVCHTQGPAADRPHGAFGERDP